jgi:hypothetical protein
MPQTVIRVFRTVEAVPLEDWLEGLQETEPRAYAKCLAAIRLLAQLGSELRRPIADTLRNGIRELRIKVGSVNYRILYFFCGSNVVCLSHGFTKERKVPDAEIELAIKRKLLVERKLEKYTAGWEI